MKAVIWILCWLVFAGAIYAGEVSNARLWLQSEYDEMDADGSENELQFMVKLPNEPGNVKFYTSCPSLASTNEGSVTITSSQLDFGIVLYAKYTAPTLVPTQSLYGEHTVTIHLEWDPNEGSSTMIELPITIDIGPKPTAPYKISNLTIEPSAQSSTIAGIIPRDTNCFALITATVTNLSPGESALVRFESNENKAGAFISYNPHFEFDRKWIEESATYDSPTVSVKYHNTQGTHYWNEGTYEDTINVSVADSTSQAVIRVGMDLVIKEVKGYVHDNANAEFGIKPFVMVNGFPDLNLEQYSTDYSDIWDQNPLDPTLILSMSLGADIYFTWMNKEHYDLLMNMTPWGTPSCYTGFVDFVHSSSTSNVLEYVQGPGEGPKYVMGGGHGMPGISLPCDGVYWFWMRGQLVIRKVKSNGSTFITNCHNESFLFATNTAQVMLTKDDGNSLVQDMLCALDPTSREQYIALELVKNVSDAANAFLFVQDVLCKLSHLKITDAIFAAVKQSVGNSKDSLEKLKDAGKITADELKMLEVLIPMMTMWDTYDHQNNLMTKTNQFDYSIDGSTTPWGSTTSYTPEPCLWADYPVPDINRQVSSDYTIPVTQLMPADPEYQHICMNYIQPWCGTNGMSDSNYVIVAALQIDNADMQMESGQSITRYRPSTFEYDDVEPAMGYFASNMAVFYMQDTNTATLTLHFTNAAAVSVIHPKSHEYSVYSMPVISAATGVLEFAANAHTNALTLHAASNVLQIAAKTYSLTGSSWVAVVLEPDTAKNAGAAWRLNDGNGRMSSRLMEVSPGTYAVEYSELSVWNEPFRVYTRAQAGKTNILFGLYGETDLVQSYDFSDASSLQGWQAKSGAWSIVSNTYQMTGNKDNIFAMSRLNAGQGDYTFSVDVRKTQGDSESTAYTYGIVIRSNTDMNKYYEFLITYDGQYYIARRDGYDSYLLKDYTVSDAIFTGYGAWNNLKVMTKGDDLEFYINDQIVWTVEDAQLSSGTPGLLAIDAAASTSNDIVQFKNARLVNGDSSCALGWLMLLLTE